MKKNDKLLIIIIACVMGLALIIGCVFGGIFLFGGNDNNDGGTPVINGEEQGTDIQGAIDYLKGLYKDEGAATPTDYKRFNVIRIAGAPYQIVWSTDVSEDLVKFVDNGDGTCVVVVNKECTEETPYQLTATISSDGKEVSHTWNYKLPKGESMAVIVDEAYKLESGQAMESEKTLTGTIVSINTPYDDNYKNVTVTIQVKGREDKPIKCYRLKGDGAEILAVGQEITVTGILKNYNGTIEFDAGCTLAPIPGYVANPQNGNNNSGNNNSGNNNSGSNNSGSNNSGSNNSGSNNSGSNNSGSNNSGSNNSGSNNSGSNNSGSNNSGSNNSGSNNSGSNQPTVTLKLEKNESKILEDAFKLGRNETTPYIAQLTGKVFSIKEYNEEYGEVTLTITAGGKRIVCYQMKGTGTDKVKVGDTITVQGVIKNFYYDDADTSGEVEFTWHQESGTEVTMVSHKAAAALDLSSPAKILAAAKALGANESLPQEVTLSGKVASIAEAYNDSFQNVSVYFTVEGTTMKCYRMTGTGVDQVKAGDTITVKGIIMNYSGNLQFGQGCVMTKRTPGTASGPETNEAKILADAFALEPGAMLPYQAKLTGKITEIYEEYNPTYDNVTVIIEVGGKTLKCYRLKGTGADKLGVGDVITVTGQIKHYVHTSSGNSEIEFDQGCTFTKG